MKMTCMLLASARERGALGEKAVARVDRVGADAERRMDDRLDLQIALARPCRADADRRDRRGARAPSRDRPPRPPATVSMPSRRQVRMILDRDLAPVRDQDSANRHRSARAFTAQSAFATRISVSPYSTSTPSRPRISVIRPRSAGAHRVHELHDFDDADDRFCIDIGTDFDERRRARLRRAIEGAEQRRRHVVNGRVGGGRADAGRRLGGTGAGRRPLPAMPDVAAAAMRADASRSPCAAAAAP